MRTSHPRGPPPLHDSVTFLSQETYHPSMSNLDDKMTYSILRLIFLFLRPLSRLLFFSRVAQRKAHPAVNHGTCA